MDDGEGLVLSLEEPLGLLGDVPGDVLGDVVVSSLRGAVEGDADGVRSPGLSPTRSVRDSVQPAMTPAPRASAQIPVSNLFIASPFVGPVSDERRRDSGGATQMPPGALDRVGGILYRREPQGRSDCGRTAMKLEGAHDIKAPRQKVWDAFLDPEVLRQGIPGCEKLEAIGNDEFKATMKIGVAAVKGTFEGKVRLLDRKPPDSYKLAVDGSGGPGFVRGETLITLTDIEGGTRVSYSADVQVGGLIAGVGQRMLGGVSKMMADQFFNRMGELLTATA